MACTPSRIVNSMPTLRHHQRDDYADLAVISCHDRTTSPDGLSRIRIFLLVIGVLARFSLSGVFGHYASLRRAARSRCWSALTASTGLSRRCGASYMNAALQNRYFTKHGLVSLLSQHRRWRMASVEPPYTEPYVRWCGGTAGVTPPPTRFLRPAWALARRCGMRGACQVLYRPGRGNGELKAAQRGWLLNERVEVPPAHIPVWRRSHVRQPTGATLTVESPDVNVLREGVSPTDQPRRLTTRGAVARANGRIVEISPQHEVGYWNVELRWSRKTGQVVKV